MSYDYTRDDAAAGSEDIEIGAYSAPQAAGEIEKENGFRTIPPGDYPVLILSHFWVGEKDDHFSVLVDGRMDSYNARPISVTFSLPNDPRCTIKDRFVLPPSDPRSIRAYNDGVSPPKPDPKTGKTPPVKPNDKGGFQSKKFFHFMDRLGFVDPSNNELTPAGRRPSNWKGRAIGAVVSPGNGSYTNREGKEVPRDAQIKLFSYRPADAAAMAGRRADAGQPQGQHAPTAPGRPAARPAMSAAGVGLDDL